VDNFLNDPVQVAVAPPASPAATVEQALAIVDHKEKREALRSLLRSEDVGNAIVFCNTKRGVGTLERSLVRHGFNAGALHGDMDQHSRIQMLDSFRKGEVTILVASDVAARGLDIPKVSHVFNFDVPNHAEDYVHRIGRTGRAGRSGKSITLAAPEEARNWDAIAKLLGRDIDRIEIEGVESLDWSAEGRSRRRGNGRDRDASRETGRRKSAERTERARPAEAAEQQEQRTPRKPERTREPAAERERTREPAPERRPVAAVPDRQADKRERGRHRGPREDTPVVGLGDHVPAFLLRPVPNLRRADGEDEAKRAAG
jgi:superfamily II DNA/RNA helicase